MKGFLDLPYRLPFVRHYQAFDRGFYVDFPKQLGLMGRWLLDHGCRRTLDIGAMTGGCIDHISSLGIRMDGVQFTHDIRRLAAARLKKTGVRSTLTVSPVHAPLRLAGTSKYDGVVSLGWLNLPFSRAQLLVTLRRIHGLLAPGGIFLFDFFQFGDLIIPPTEAVRLTDDLLFVSHAERRGDVLRRHHLWVVDGRPPRAETSDLVRRTSKEARGLLKEAGFKLLREEFLDFHYPREFWLARKG